MNILIFASTFPMFVDALVPTPHNPYMKGSVGELYQVLNTRDKMWLDKRRNISNNHKCLSWQKVYLGGRGTITYTFNETYFEELSQKTTQLNGTLIMKNSFDATGAALNVTGTNEAGENLEYLLVHWNKTYRCAIFYTQEMINGTRRNQTCGLYYWSSYIDKAEARNNCDIFYNLYCGPYGTDQVLYDSNCQTYLAC
uniref:Putative lipocalin n=1 Tax=Rhipicephalus microplus TaxID=6941 RepID=A0A6G5A4Y5_RHIMP|nr:uncharacterized protein LOC119174270 [Rhipicephalus microplus]